MKSLLRIIVNETAETDHKQILYEWVKHFLWEKGFPGLTIRRGEMNLDNQGRRHISILEDQPFNDLALIIETVHDNEQIKAVIPELEKHIPHGQISVTKGMEEKDMSDHRYFTVKVYTKEENSWFKKEEYEKVLTFFQKKNAIWTSVTKGIVGYGKDRVIHRQKIFSVSEQTPVVVECIISSDHLTDLLAGLKNLVEEGAVFTTPVHLIINK
ncbi:DUF190 domain-containing protein [Sporolactobacillus shoreicorticis]|uniref:DUF190 domain-containing protein n=1 Tax=Sporolactobacillus shoreicorticis TaxID=1923877 RepID=A0ABW5RZL5_9BACL|nr:DUF190 domain-containing protein [Sporolactobacillus shoreicorticis]MCO7127245.1 DUF190 domain-containing protein [Sporolactobacillus shoreicorticis]